MSALWLRGGVCGDTVCLLGAALNRRGRVGRLPLLRRRIDLLAELLLLGGRKDLEHLLACFQAEAAIVGKRLFTNSLQSDELLVGPADLATARGNR